MIKKYMCRILSNFKYKNYSSSEKVKICKNKSEHVLPKIYKIDAQSVKRKKKLRQCYFIAK